MRNVQRNFVRLEKAKCFLYLLTALCFVMGFYAVWENGRGGLVDQPDPNLPVAADVTSDWHRTVVLIEKHLLDSQVLWIRGGTPINKTTKKSCTSDDSNSQCSISIKHILSGDAARSAAYTDWASAAYTAWASGDTKLDWYGAEPGQADHKGTLSEGTPTLWTTNTGLGDHFVNTFGPHYWMMNVDMNCGETDNGWFEFYTMTNSGREEHLDMKIGQACWGNAGGLLPYSSTNHLARCGYINVFWSGVSNCKIDKFY